MQLHFTVIQNYLMDFPTFSEKQLPILGDESVLNEIDVHTLFKISKAPISLFFQQTRIVVISFDSMLIVNIFFFFSHQKAAFNQNFENDKNSVVKPIATYKLFTVMWWNVDVDEGGYESFPYVYPIKGLLIDISVYVSHQSCHISVGPKSH